MDRTLGICRCCKRLSVIDKSNICSDCIDKQEDRYQIVKNYLYDNKGATVNTVSQECDVSKTSILRWLREERIEVMENSTVKLNCLRCNTDILSGSYCYDCQQKVNGERGRDNKSSSYNKNMKAYGKSRKEEDKMRFF